MDSKDEQLKDLVNSVGIVYQLLITRFNQIVGDDFVPFSQFILLSHFMKDTERPRTVSSVASAFQAPQPGITKTIQKLVEQGLISEKLNPDDRRSKTLFITKKGQSVFKEAIKLLAPDIRQTFSVVTDQEIKVMHTGLNKLKSWLDNNRHNVVGAKD